MKIHLKRDFDFTLQNIDCNMEKEVEALLLLRVSYIIEIQDT